MVNVEGNSVRRHLLTDDQHLKPKCRGFGAVNVLSPLSSPKTLAAFLLNIYYLPAGCQRTVISGYSTVSPFESVIKAQVHSDLGAQVAAKHNVTDLGLRLLVSLSERAESITIVLSR